MKNKLSVILKILVAPIMILFASSLYYIQGYQPVCEQITSGPIGEMDPVISPDGRWLAFREFIPEGDKTSDVGWLSILPLDPVKREKRLLLNPDQFHGGASWSPDSLWISYCNYVPIQPGSTLVERQIYKVNIVSGERVQLTPDPPIPDIGGFTSWSEHGEIAFVKDTDIYAIRQDGSNLRKLVDVGSKEPNLQPIQLVWSRDGKSLAFSAERIRKNGKKDESTLWLANVQSGHLRQITTGVYDENPTWQDSDTIIFSRSSDKAPKVSLYSVSIRTREIKRIRHRGMGYSPWVDQKNQLLYFISAERFDVSGNDFIFFRGFHIWRLSINTSMGK
jgi:Tol biopolymer transport system component